MADYILIMAGGKGERLWPLSRADRPKQFIPLLPGNRSLFQATFERATKIVNPDRVYVVTGTRYIDLVREQVPDLSEDHVVVEPVGRDTAPCLALGTTFLVSRDEDATILALPSDHHIADEEEFKKAVRRAFDVARNSDYIVTIGIVPARPETGFGYLRRGEKISSEWVQSNEGEAQPIPVFEVNRFVEKPDQETAEAMLEEGGWYWNGGMFCYSGKVFLVLYKTLLPADGPLLDDLLDAFKTKGTRSASFGGTFNRFTKISVDYGIMEKAPKIAMVPGDFGWDDVGSWAALERMYDRDEAGNVIVGKVPYVLDAESCIFYSCEEEKHSNGGRLPRVIAALGIRGVVVVHSGDALLVADKSRLDRMKTLLDGIRSSDDRALLETAASLIEEPRAQELQAEGEFVEKPWGYEIWWANTPEYVGKIIFIRAGESTSLQYHQVKKETMLCLSGKATLLLNGNPVRMTRGKSVTINPLDIHRLEADTDLIIIEVSTSEVEDVVRVADRYGRSEKKA